MYWKIVVTRLKFDMATCLVLWNGMAVTCSKTNTDPEKVEWQLSVEDSIEEEKSTTDDQEPFVAPLELGHEKLYR